MNLFQHKESNEKKEAKAKKVLLSLATINLKKYIVAQKIVYNMLLKGVKTKKQVKTLNGIYHAMQSYHDAVNEIEKSLKLIFNEDFNRNSILIDLMDKYFPEARICFCKRCQADREEGINSMSMEDIINDPEAPSSLKNVVSKIKDALRGRNMDAKVTVHDLGKDARDLGLDPNDYTGFKDLIAAIESAKDAKAKVEQSDSPEEFLNDSVIKNAENIAASGEHVDEKLN